MESNKAKKRRVTVIDFSKDKKRALRILEDEKKAREAMRKKDELGIEIEIPKDIEEIIKEAEVA